MAILSLLFAALCIDAVVITVVGVSFVRRLMKGGIGEGHNEMSGAVFAVGGTVYAVFLAFLVVAAWELHDAAKDNVAEEASALGTLYRGSAAMEPRSGGELREVIRRYTHAVILDEWPVQAEHGGAADTARRAALDMFYVFGDMPPQARQDESVIDQIQLGLVTQIQADRNRRTLQAQERLSPLIWWIALVNGLMVVVMSFFLYPDRDWPHFVMTSMLAVMVAMLLFVISIFGRPFSGLSPLQPEAFRHSLEVYDSVDRMMARSAGRR